MADNSANILDVIFHLESSRGTDPKRLKLNKDGALGSYQLIENKSWADVKKKFPKKYKGLNFREVALSDTLSREAAGDYVGIISQHLVNNNIAPTMSALLSGYHDGMGNVSKGKIGPKGLQYLKRADILLKGGL